VAISNAEIDINHDYSEIIKKQEKNDNIMQWQIRCQGKALRAHSKKLKKSCK